MTVSQKYSMYNASFSFYLEGGPGLALGTRGSVMRLVAEKTSMSLPKVFVLFHRPGSSNFARRYDLHDSYTWQICPAEGHR